MSAALAAEAQPGRAPRGRSLVWTTALAATLVAGVAGLSVSMLQDCGAWEPATRPWSKLKAPRRDGLSVPASAAVLGNELAPAAAMLQVANHSPSYVTPAGSAGASTILRTQLADYIVAHSAYSTPLLRRNMLSELISSEDAMGFASSYTGAAGAAQGTLAGSSDAIRSSSGSSR